MLRNTKIKTAILIIVLFFSLNSQVAHGATTTSRISNWWNNFLSTLDCRIVQIFKKDVVCLDNTQTTNNYNDTQVTNANNPKPNFNNTQGFNTTYNNYNNSFQQYPTNNKNTNNNQNTNNTTNTQFTNNTKESNTPSNQPITIVRNITQPIKERVYTVIEKKPEITKKEFQDALEQTKQELRQEIESVKQNTNLQLASYGAYSAPAPQQVW